MSDEQMSVLKEFKSVLENLHMEMRKINRDTTEFFHAKAKVNTAVMWLLRDLANTGFVAPKTPVEKLVTDTVIREYFTSIDSEKEGEKVVISLKDNSIYKIDLIATPITEEPVVEEPVVEEPVVAEPVVAEPTK